MRGVRDARVQGCQFARIPTNGKRDPKRVSIERERNSSRLVLFSLIEAALRDGKCAYVLHQTDIRREEAVETIGKAMRRATYVSSERETKRSEASRGESRRVEATVRRA